MLRSPVSQLAIYRYLALVYLAHLRHVNSDSTRRLFLWLRSMTSGISTESSVKMDHSLEVFESDPVKQKFFFVIARQK
jgi:hypothetical protein